MYKCDGDQVFQAFQYESGAVYCYGPIVHVPCECMAAICNFDTPTPTMFLGIGCDAHLPWCDWAVKVSSCVWQEVVTIALIAGTLGQCNHLLMDDAIGWSGGQVGVGVGGGGGVSVSQGGGKVMDASQAGC